MTRDVDSESPQTFPQRRRCEMRVLLLLVVTATAQATACKVGFVDSDVPGVCVEHDTSKDTTNPAWVSDEKPPTNKMPSYQREGVTVVDAPSTRQEDEKFDQEKREADKSGKKAAGIK